MAEFNESEHPRDKDGKFTDKGNATKSKFKKLAALLKNLKKLRLHDEILPRSVGAKWSNYEILMPDGTKAQFVEGSKLHPEVFAGFGTHKPIEEIGGLNYRHKTNSTKWRKVKSDAEVLWYGEQWKAEVHWYEEPSVGKVEFKCKKLY